MARVDCSLVDLLLFYTQERVLFNRMVCSMGKSSKQVKKVIALWLVLEEIGYHDLIRAINCLDNTGIEALHHEALQCLECIQPNSVTSVQAQELLGLFDEPMRRRFLYCNRDFIYRRYEHVMETVCDKIFGENKAVEAEESRFRRISKPPGKWFYEQGLAASQYSLNPDAIEFNPAQTPEESRTMFLTFSMGHPLSREEIIRFFTKKWGEVVKDVYIERTEAGQDPQFGRMVLKNTWVIARILNGEAKAKFLVNGKHLWARIYVPRRRGIVEKPPRPSTKH